MRQDSDRMKANSFLRCDFAMGGSWSHKEQPCEVCHYGANQEDKSNEESVIIAITKQDKNILLRDCTIQGQEKKHCLLTE